MSGDWEIDWAPCPTFECVEVDEETLKALAAAPFALLPHDVRVEQADPVDMTEIWRDAYVERDELCDVRADLMKKLEAELDAAIARAEAAEKRLPPVGTALTIQNDSGVPLDIDVEGCTITIRPVPGTALSRLAERDASARRWVRLGCALALLLPLTAHAADAPPAPPQPTLEQQINADLASLSSNNAHNAAIIDNWQSTFKMLGHLNDNLRAQVDVVTKERDELKAKLAAQPKEDKPGG